MSLRINDLSITLDRNPILKSVSMNFKPGEVNVITGPNGSGKTTLIKSIMGLIKAPKSSIYLMERDLRSYRILERAKIIGYVPQFTQKEFDFSVYEMIEMGRYAFKSVKKSDESFIREAMELTGITELSKRLINSLSGGELQRVLLARALVINPKFLVLDEPYSNLDISHNISMMRLIKNLTRKFDITTIMVLHDLNSIYRYSDKVLLLKDGRVKGAGIPGEVITKESIRELFDVDISFVLDQKEQKHIIIN